MKVFALRELSKFLGRATCYCYKLTLYMDRLNGYILVTWEQEINALVRSSSGGHGIT